MPKFRVIASDVTFYRGVVEANSKEEIERMEDLEELDLEEYDGEAMQIVLVEEIKE